jgi:transporter family-2 protein
MGALVQHLFLYAHALGAGGRVATQQVLNGSLRTALGSPAWAGLVSYAGGLLTMIVAVIVLRERVPAWKTVVDVPWYAWSGGLFGGAFILLAILLLPSLGAATLFALVIAGQVLAAITLDHFGAFGLAPHPIGVARLAGAALLIAGVILIRD